MKKIVIIDDHKIVRTGLKALISEIEGVEVVAEGATGIDLLAIVSSITPDLIILDISMPEMDGIEVLEELKKRKLKYNILMASMFDEYMAIQKCISLGVNGYIFKDEDDKEYIKAITKISNGENYFTPKCVRLLELSERTSKQ